MAYDARQKRIMARALAVTGGNVAATARYLRDNTVECGDVAESTIRRLRDTEEFAALVAEQRKIVDQEAEEAARVAERSRLKHEMEGTFSRRVHEMEAKGWEMFERLCTMAEASDYDPKQLLSFWRTAQAFAIDLRKQAGEGIHELWQAEVLIRAFREVIQAHIGPALAEAAMKEAWKRYQEYVQAHAEDHAARASSPCHGLEAPAAKEEEPHGTPQGETAAAAIAAP